MLNRKITLISMLAFLGFLVGSCASIVSKSQYPIAFTSDPDGAKFTITDGNGQTMHTGQTPDTITLKAGSGYFKGENYTVEFEKEGFESRTISVERGVDGWYIVGNLLFGGLIGWLIVDPITGAMYTLPKTVNGDLSTTVSSEFSDSEAGLRLATLENIPLQDHHALVKIN